MAGKAKTGDRVRTVEVEKEAACPECGKPTRLVKRMKDREMNIAAGMYRSCTVCDYAQKK